MNNKGSFTVEAAFAVPIFFFCMMALLFLFQVILLQTELQTGMTEAGKELSQLAYIKSCQMKEGEKDTKNAFLLEGKRRAEGVIVAEEISKYFTFEKEHGNLLRGKILYGNSSYLDEEQCIDLIAKYTVKIPIPLFHLAEFPLMQRVRIRAFTGTDKIILSEQENTEGQDGEKQYVYITETGMVYHRFLECSSLNLKISECSLKEVGNRRNTSGGKYKPCEKCCKRIENIALVYIGEDGDAYHCFLNCSGLKRTIHRVLLQDVENKMRECMRCRK